MKPMKKLVLLAFLLAPGVAAAQGYYGGSGPGYYQQPAATQLPGGFHIRQGWTRTDRQQQGQRRYTCL